MNKLMHKVYYRDRSDPDSKVWTLLAAFVNKKDAAKWIGDQDNSVPPEENTGEWKIMSGKKVIGVINNGS